jgi:hypothetical protein
VDEHRPDVPRPIPVWLEGAIIIGFFVVVVIAAYLYFWGPQQANIFPNVNNAIPYPAVSPTP